MLKIMKKLYMILMTIVISSVGFLSCTQKEESFFTATEDDAPRILNTDIPDWKDGQPQTLLTISRDQNFEFEVVVTPADYTTVEWFLDDVKVAEGKTISQPVLAGTWTVKIVATTTKGLSTYRVAKLVVNPLEGDPVAGDAILERLVAPGATAVLGGQNMDKVKKVVIGGVECDATYADGVVTYTVPADMAAGTYQLTLKDAEGNEYGAAYITVSDASVVSAAAFSGKPGGELVLTGLNLDKVATLTAGDQACAIVSKAAGELKVTLPDLAKGSYDLAGVDASGNAVNFVDGTQMLDKASLTITAEETLWEGHHYVSWDFADGDPNKTFSALAEASMAWTPGKIIRVTLTPDSAAEYHQVQFNTMWWSELPGTMRGDFFEATIAEITWTQELSDLVNAQGGFIVCGHGFFVDKVTIE